jgi:hypothetical protein
MMDDLLGWSLPRAYTLDVFTAIEALAASCLRNRRLKLNFLKGQIVHD